MGNRIHGSVIHGSVRLAAAGIFLLLLSGLPTSSLTAGGASPDSELPAGVRERLDHMIGTWDCTWEYLDARGNVTGKATGTEVARFILEDRIIEMTTDVPRLGLKSKSWFFYSIPRKEFILTSVDPRGDLWELTGPLEPRTLTSKPKKGPDGKEMQIRFTEIAAGEDEVKAFMETTDDGGKTWRPGFRQTLTRRRERSGS